MKKNTGTKTSTKVLEIPWVLPCWTSDGVVVLPIVHHNPPEMTHCNHCNQCNQCKMQNAKAELPSVLVIVVLVELVALGSGDENLNFDVFFLQRMICI